MHASRRTLTALGAVAAAAAVWVAAAVPVLAAAPGTTLLVNRPSGFGGANPGFSNHSSLWGDPGNASEQSLRVVSDSEGNRYVAFVSDADGLSADDDDRFPNVFVRDRVTNTTILVSRATGPTGEGANGFSGSPAISANGRYVAFTSSATNLSDADEGGTTQVYVRDIVGNTTTLMSRATGASGQIASSSSVEPAIAVSGGNPRVAFTSAAANLPGGNGTHRQVYLRSGSTTTLISSVNGNAAQAGAGHSSQPAMDDDGTFVAFTSDAVLTAGDANDDDDVFRREVAGNGVLLVSSPAGNGPSWGPSISDNGDRVAFTSQATNLTLDDTDSSPDVLVRSINIAATVLASRSSGGVNGNGVSTNASINGAGTRVAFVSTATNLAPADTDSLPDAYLRHLDGPSVTVLSTSTSGSSTEAIATAASISRDGNRTAWQGTAPPREANDDDDFVQVYTSYTGPNLSIFQSGWVSRPTGTGPFRSGVNAGDLRAPGRSEDTIRAMSADGRYTAFISGADELSPDDDNRFINVFRRDNLTGETILVSRADGPAGAAANGSSAAGGGGLSLSPAPGPAISADGRMIAFQSDATNLVPSDGNGFTDVFVRDVVAGTTVRASVGPGGAEIATGGGDPDINGDGTKVVFSTAAAVDPLKDGNNKADIYLRDLSAGTTTLVSRRDGQDTVAGGESSTHGAISADGTTVAFQSESTDLDLTVPDGNAKGDVFVRRLAAGQTRLVSVRNSVAQTGNDTSYAPAIDATGTRVAFVSRASDLAPFDINGTVADVFVRDTVAGTTTLVSRSTGAAGVSGNSGAGRPAISADGARVAFESLAGNLVPGDTNSGYDIFIRDIPAATTELVSRTHTGAQIDQWTVNPSLSANGDCIAFQTNAAGVVPGTDGTDFSRVFARALRGDCPFGPVAAPPPDPGAPGAPGTTPPPAADTTKPRITLLRAAPRRFTAGPRFRAATRRRQAVGTRLRIRVSEPSRVVLRIVALQPGRRVGKRCVVRARTGRTCIRATTRGTLNAGRVANLKRVVFTGRVRGRLLPPGRYRLVATATDPSGNRSAARAIIVTVVRKAPARTS